MNWSMLPGNIVLSICDLLPSYQTGVMRLVCKTWSSQISGSISSLVTNAVCPYPTPVAKIPCLFPNLIDLDLSCHKWGSGQTISQKMSADLHHLKKLKNLKSLRLENWVALTHQGMEFIVSLKKLEILDLMNCLSVTDKFLHCFCLSKANIKHLVLSGCEKITDTGISHLSSSLSNLVELRIAHIPGLLGKTLWQLSKKLEYLDISYCENLSDEGMRHMLNLGGYVTNLGYLDLSGCQNIQSNTLASLSTLSRLTRLNVSCLPQLVEMEQWSQLTKLKVLDVSFASRLVMQHALPVIARMTQLRSLRLDGCTLLNIGAKAESLKDLKFLRWLDLGRWSNLQFGLDVFDYLNNLEVLNLADGGGCVRSHQNYFKNATKLKVLGLSGYAYIPMNVIRGLSTVSSLEVLHLSGLGNLNDKMVQHISKLTSLTYLDLSQNGVHCKVSKFGIKHLGHLKLLKSLKICGWSEMSSNGFLILRQLKQLTSLDVSNCLKLTDKGVKAISSASSLVELSIINCFQVTCEGLAHLKKCTQLETLTLSHHIKGDVETILTRVKKILFVSPVDFVIGNGNGNSRTANFQLMLETLSREEKEDTPTSSHIKRILTTM